MLEKSIEDSMVSNKIKLLDVCKTRWLQRIDGLARFTIFLSLYIIALKQ